MSAIVRPNGGRDTLHFRCACTRVRRCRRRPSIVLLPGHHTPRLPPPSSGQSGSRALGSDDTMDRVYDRPSTPDSISNGSPATPRNSILEPRAPLEKASPCLVFSNCGRISGVYSFQRKRGRKRPLGHENGLRRAGVVHSLPLPRNAQDRPTDTRISEKAPSVESA